MNILRRELKRNYKSFLIWVISMVATIIYVMSLYPSIAKNSAGLVQLIHQMPEALRKAFNLDRLSMTDILGYYGTEAGVIILLGGSIFSILLAASMLSKEENDRTVEFLLAKPVTRSEVITDKVLAYLVYTVLFNVILFVATYLSFEHVKMQDYPVKTLYNLFLAYFLVQITFANIGLLASVFVTKRHSITSLAIWVVLGMYFVSTLTGITKELDFLKYLTPFKYADSADIIINGAINRVYLLILMIVNAAAIVLTYVMYNRKNINV